MGRSQLCWKVQAKILKRSVSDGNCLKVEENTLGHSIDDVGRLEDVAVLCKKN